LERGDTSCDTAVSIKQISGE